MNYQERRLRRRAIGDRRIITERRIASNDDYDGVEHRIGKDRRTLIDRRNLY